MANLYEGMDPRIQALMNASQPIGEEDDLAPPQSSPTAPPEKEMQLDPVPPESMSMKPIAAPQMMSPEDLQDREDSSQKDARMRTLVGGIGDILSNQQSFGNFYLGRMNPKSDAGARTAQSMNEMTADPMKRQAQLYSNYKQAQDSQNQQIQVAQTAALRDPNSTQSKALKAAYGKYDVDVTPEDSGATLIFNYGSLADLSAAKREHEDKLELAGINNQSRQDIKALGMAQLYNSRKMHDQDRQDANEHKDAMALENTLSKGWTARSGQAGVVQGKIVAAEAAEQLIDQGKNQEGGLDARQVEELAQSTAKLLGGGASASARVDALVPHTFWGNAQSAKEWLSNKPQGADLQHFTDRMAETVTREKALANDQKRQFQIESLAAHARLRNSNPELYGQILSSKGIDPSMIDGSGRYAPQIQQAKSKSESPPPATTKLSQQDQKAVDWAMANPSDKRSADILRHNGVQVGSK